MDGIILIDKPQNMTSHDVVMIARKKLKTKKVGHTGTLDPFATGLMILVVGKATKLSNLFIAHDKSYTGSIKFGYLTDSYDLTGVTIKKKTPDLTKNTLQIALANMINTYEQIPPMYSAIKQNGIKMYDLARKGITVAIPARTVTIFDFKMTSLLINDEFSFETKVSKGTYIRSLTYDLGLSLDEYATLTSLRRISSGTFLIDEATSLEELSPKNLIGFDIIFKNTPKLVLEDYHIHLVKHGVYLDERQTTANEPFIVVNQNDLWIAYYIPVENGKYKPSIFFEGAL